MAGVYAPRQEGEWENRSVLRGIVTVFTWVVLARLTFHVATFALHTAGWNGPRLFVTAVATGVVVASVTMRLYCVHARRRRSLSTAARAYRSRQGIRR